MSGPALLPQDDQAAADTTENGDSKGAGRKPSTALEMVGSFLQRTGSAIIQPFALCTTTRTRLSNRASGGDKCVTSELYKKGGTLYVKGLYTLWRTDEGDYEIAYAADKKHEGRTSSFRTSSFRPSRANQKSAVTEPGQHRVQKIEETSNARLEFDITTEEVLPPFPMAPPAQLPEPLFGSAQGIWKMRATTRAEFNEVNPLHKTTTAAPLATQPALAPVPMAVDALHAAFGGAQHDSCCSVGRFVGTGAAIGLRRMQVKFCRPSAMCHRHECRVGVPCPCTFACG